MKEIKYQAIWGRLYLLFAILFGLIFIIASYLLDDYSNLFNLIGALVIGYIGYSMLKRPYLRYSKNAIIVYNYIGSIRKSYQFVHLEDIKLKSNRLYLNGEKLKINDWMVRKADWNRFINYYDQSNSIINELQD